MTWARRNSIHRIVRSSWGRLKYIVILILICVLCSVVTPGRGPALGFLISGIRSLQVLVLPSHSLVKEFNDVLYIMSWTDAVEDRTIPGEREGPVSVNLNNCDMKPGQDCVYMKRNPQNLDQYRRTHVVLFNSHYIKLGDLPQEDRPSNQLWIVRLSESPSRTNVKTLEHMRYRFNGTISYMLNADIKWLLVKFSWFEDSSDGSNPRTGSRSGKENPAGEENQWERRD